MMFCNLRRLQFLCQVKSLVPLEGLEPPRRGACSLNPQRSDIAAINATFHPLIAIDDLAPVGCAPHIIGFHNN
jgi:hypothetical protein